MLIMTQRFFSLVTAVLFVLIALLHAVRLLRGWQVTIEAQSCQCGSAGWDSPLRRTWPIKDSDWRGDDRVQVKASANRGTYPSR